MRQPSIRPMLCAAVLSLCVVPAAAAKPAGHGHGAAKGRPQRAVAALAIPDGGVDANARGRLDVKHFPAVGKRAERSWFRLKLNRLDGTDYTLWMDDPATPETDLVEVAGLTANDDGHAHFGADTKREEALPFGAALADLGGMALEVRDGTGNVVLTGTVPVLQ